MWPGNRDFAFTIFDDTDNALLEDVIAVYDVLLQAGIKTTKSVWMFDSIGKSRIGGISCANEKYCQYVKSLKNNGFEIALHNVSSSHSNRAQVIEGFNLFRKYFDEDPQSFANHADNRENLYWGADRLSGFRKFLYKIFARNHSFSGHEPGSEWFWGDIAEDRLKYVRNFMFEELNTQKMDPFTPYRDLSKPFVNYWFSSSNAENIDVFKRNVTKEAIDRLEKEGGYTILYTHFCTFAKNGRPDPYFTEIVDYLKGKNGWYVPVSTLLDYLTVNLSTAGNIIGPAQRRWLELRWLIDIGISRLKYGR